MSSQLIFDLILKLLHKLIQWKNCGIFFSMQTEGYGSVFFLIEADNQKIRHLLHLSFTHTIAKLLGSVIEFYTTSFASNASQISFA